MLRKLLGSKRIMSGLFAIILTVSTITAIKADVLQPQQPFTVSISNVAGAQGDIVEVPVAINTPTTPIASYQMQLEFDKSKIEVAEIKPQHGTSNSDCGSDENGCFVSNINNNDGWLKTVWVDSSGGNHPITSAKTLFTIKLKLKSNALTGNTKLEIDKAQQGNILFSDAQGQEISPVAISGGTLAIYEPAPIPNKDVRVVPVVLEDGTQAAKVEIVRTTEKDGAKKDSINFDEQKANETIEQAVKANKNTATIVVVEPEKDKSDLIEVGIKKEAVAKLSENNINIKIQSEKASVEVPLDTVKQLMANGQDLFFRMEKLKDSISYKNTEALVKQANPAAKLVSEPVEVETNFNGHTKVVVPLDQTALPQDKKQLAEFLKTLSVHIQHSDGEIKVDKGEVVYDKNGNPTGIAVWVEKFSTFTIIGSEKPKATKEIGFVKISKRINLWTRDENHQVRFSKILNPGEVYKVYNIDKLHGGQYAVGGGAWITNMNSYVSYRSIAQYGATASMFPKGQKRNRLCHSNKTYEPLEKRKQRKNERC
ncbi:cohesin domain-containing protein [Neobacillus sp. PS3-34]|uniref:cohesin domain-containing protein n=1 Tax=Neobacillus sp. PS3-34 TaxID=3070678 RepID=UPI0027E0EDFE|nr:cohesin domain-containing protein [Neobacillus sp. PS3-34]WML46816.1 cohesin domain-containing protein [Neobacillus sp. PS3-34]